MDIRSFATERSKIWVRGEPSPEPYIPCYVPRVERSGTRAQRGSERSGESSPPPTTIFFSPHN